MVFERAIPSSSTQNVSAQYLRRILTELLRQEENGFESDNVSFRLEQLIVFACRVHNYFTKGFGFGVMSFRVTSICIMPFRVTPICVMPFRVIPFCVLPFRVIPICVMPFRVMPICVVPFRAMPICVMPFLVMP